MKKLDLGKEKISKLLLSFAIPCIISLVVNALYNIVDQIFIGWGVGYLGNGATNVVFPITVVCLAFALMFGDGSSSFLSLKLGEGNKKEAKKGIFNGIIGAVSISILLLVVVLWFLPQLLNVFGCTENIRQFALDYGFVIAIGLPFMMVGTTLNSIIRADGSPKYAMTSMVIGAILNVILDPIAIFALNMGVRGAAIATVISQIVTFLLNLLYLRKLKTIELDKEARKISLKYMLQIALLGISSFITQIAIVVIIAVENKMINTYGVESKFGADIPITVVGIVMKINQILSSIIIGIAAGSQPIVGYNYGARNYSRVKQTLKYVLVSCTIVSIVAFCLFQTIPEKLISIFGAGDALYNEFACLTFRIYLMLTIFNGIQISSGIFFQALGKPAKSAFLTLSRQILFFVPAAIILSKMFGIIGLLAAGPVADGLAFLIAVILITTEIISLNKKKNTDEVEKEDEKIVNKEIEKQGLSKSNVIITINREYGSGGRYVGRLLAKKLGVKLYDKDLIEFVSNESGLSAKYIEENEQNITGSLLANFNTQYYNNLTNNDNLFIAESSAIEKIAQNGGCVIVGRCADYVLRENKEKFSVFLYSDEISKIKRVTKHYGIDEKDAIDKITKINKARQKHYEHYTNRKWMDSSNYDFSINVDMFGVEKTAEIIYNLVKEKKNK